MFLDCADFRDATFKGRADFRGAVFRSDANFRRAIFKGEARFDPPRAEKTTDDATGDEASSDGATLEPSTVERPDDPPESRDGARFFGEARFRWVAFHRDADFRYAKFMRDADFRDTAFSKRARFRDTDVHRKIDFSGASLMGRERWRFSWLARRSPRECEKSYSILRHLHARFGLS